MYRALTILGSTSPTSRTRVVARAVSAALSQYGVDNHLFDVKACPLPPFDVALRGHDRAVEPNTQALYRLASEAHGLILATPTYHDSYSSSLKNALDFLSDREVAGKPVGLICHGGARTTQPLAHLRVVVRSLGGLAINTQVCTEDSDLRLDGAGRGEVTSAAIAERVARFCEEFSHELRLRSGALESGETPVVWSAPNA